MHKDALKRAIEMEKEGRHFYLQAAEGAKNTLVKKVFEQLAKEEELHMQKIEEIYALLDKEGSVHTWITAIVPADTLRKVFRESLVEKAISSEDEINVLNFAAKREEESIKYYEELAQRTDDAKERRFYLALSYEEKGHYLTIMDTLEYLKNPVDWMRLQEKNILEG
ncbi:MAG: ferritin family protein [Candidatus Desulfofervidaceae bacterium]|nr:ferritin family protein [Candidatus Desulfofervidaceae bacterium]